MTREEYIQKVVDSALPLSARQIARLAALFDSTVEKPRANRRNAAAEAA
jgi:hypothetical protein